MEIHVHIHDGIVKEGDAPKTVASQSKSTPSPKPSPKKKRKASAYQKKLGIELKKLKKKHPRTKMSTLMKKAHRLAKKKK